MEVLCYKCPIRPVCRAEKHEQIIYGNEYPNGHLTKLANEEDCPLCAIKIIKEKK